MHRCANVARLRRASLRTSRLVSTKLCSRKVIHGDVDNSNLLVAGVFLIRNALGTTAAHWERLATHVQVATMERGRLVAVRSRDISFATHSQQLLPQWFLQPNR